MSAQNGIGYLASKLAIFALFVCIFAKMNWNDLKTFLAIADSGSLAAAARNLKQNHSTVFRRLKALEQDLNTRLFDRHAGGYSLTGAGHRMAELARPAQQSFDAIAREIAGQDLAASGTVRLTTAPNLARTLLPRCLAQLRQSHPDIVVEIAVGDGEFDLNRREADIALRATRKPPEHLVGRRLMQLDWWVCGSRPQAKLSDLKQLGQFPLIGADASLMRLPVFQWLEAHCSSAIVARANDLSTMAALAREGVGLALLPSDQEEAGLARQLRLSAFSGELWLLTHPDLRSVQRIRAVWDALLHSAQSVPSNAR